jgi:hypothetical protein
MTEKEFNEMLQEQDTSSKPLLGFKLYMHHPNGEVWCFCGFSGKDEAEEKISKLSDHIQATIYGLSNAGRL